MTVNLPPGAVEDGGMVAEPVPEGWIAYHTITATMLHRADRDALAWGRGPTAEAALADARRRGCREIEDPGSPPYRRLLPVRFSAGFPLGETFEGWDARPPARPA